jgi:uncharacterized protein (TIGR03437 family)
VRVRDSAGVERSAGIAFASPGQVNYHLPPETAEGTATVTITSADGVSRTARLGVARISPAFFVANSDGLAAALLIRARADGQQVVEQAVMVDRENFLVPAPIDLGADSDRLILLLYGTGFRLRSSLGAVQVQIGGENAVVHYAGAQGEFPGLDQLNVEIPRSLRGRGIVDITVTVDGEEAEPLAIQIR